MVWANGPSTASNGLATQSKHQGTPGPCFNVFHFSTDNTWEKLDNLAGSKKMVAEFDKREAEKELKLAEKEFAVEKIVDEKIYKKKTVYLVKWKGYKTE